MKLLITPTFVFSAFILASCAASPTTSSSATESDGSADTVAADPDFGPKCIQRIRAGLADANSADIALEGSNDQLHARVTTTNPENGQKAYQDYVCKRDKDRAVTAKLITN